MHFVWKIISFRQVIASVQIGSVAAIVCAVSLALGGCVAPSVTPSENSLSVTPVPTSAAPHISSVSPNALQQGKAATLDLQVNQWSPGTQVALVPAGPYLTHQLNLSSPPVAMVVDGPRVFIATDDRQLSIVDFSEKAARVLAQLSLAGPVQQLAHEANRLLVVLADGRLQWVDVAKPELPKVFQTMPSLGKVRDVQLAASSEAGSAYFLLEGDRGRVDLQEWVLPEGKSSHQGRRWVMPTDSTAIAVRDQYVWAVGSEGVALLDISAEQAVLKDIQRTSGIPDDVQLQDDLALVADGRGGLVIFDTSTPDVLQWSGSYNKHGAIRSFSASVASAASLGGMPAASKPTRLFSSNESALLNLSTGSVLRVGLANPELPSSGAIFQPNAPVVFSDLQGDVALLATEHSLQRVMMVGDGDGAISSEGVNLGGSRRGAFGQGSREDILYVADWFSGLHLYDISNPRQLRHLSNYHTPGSSKGVTLFGNYALVGDDDQGLQIIDIEDPRRPSWTAELTPKAMADLGLAYTMKLVGKILYLADHRGGFHIIDLSDIYHPRRLGGYDTPGKAWDIDVEGDVAFVADDRGGLLMFDVSDPTKPEPFAQFNPGGQAEDVALQDGRAYVAFFDKGLYTLDVSNPRQAKIIGHTQIPGNARGIELADGLLYIASWEAGLQVVDTRFSKSEGRVVPRVIGSFDTDGAAWGVKVKDGYAYVLDWWGGIKVVDVRQPSRPTYVGRYHARGNLQQLRTKDTYLYAASGSGGLQVYDIKNPLNPIWAKGLDIDGQSQDLWIEDDRVYVAAGDGGVAIFDILDPFYTRQVGGIDTPGDATLVRAGNEYLYIADSQAGLLVMDVRDPQRPVEVARYDFKIRDLWLDEQDLWLVTDKGLSRYWLAEDGSLMRAISKATNKAATKSIFVAGDFTAVRSHGDLLIASTASGKVTLWRRSQKDLEALGQYMSGDTISGLHLDENSLYLVGPRNGLQALDISQPTSPRLTAVYPATGNHTQVGIARGAAFFTGERRLASVTLLPAATVEPNAKGGLSMKLPADLPLGNYHLLSVSPNGQRELQPNAFSVRFSAPGQRKFSLDSFRQLLKSPLKPPTEAVTDIPAGNGKSP